VYKKENVGEQNKKELAMAAIRERKKKKDNFFYLRESSFFKRSASVWFCEVSESC
jgi:hypothetical protein